MNPRDESNLSATETILKVLEEFGESEAEHVLVIWTNQQGKMCLMQSGELRTTEAIGMLLCAKRYLLKEFSQSLEEPGEDG